MTILPYKPYDNYYLYVCMCMSVCVLHACMWAGGVICITYPQYIFVLRNVHNERHKAVLL